jgi:hypothetical protein
MLVSFDSHEAQKKSRILEVLRNAAVTGALIALSLNGAKNQFGSNLGIAQFDIDPKRINTAAYNLEQSGKNNDAMLAQQLKADTKVQNAFAGLEYNTNKLRDNFESFQKSRSPSKSTFGNYLESGPIVAVNKLQQGEKQTLEDALKISATDFEKLPFRKQNLKLLESTEPELAVGIEAGDVLPDQVQKLVSAKLDSDLLGMTVTADTTMQSARTRVIKQVNETIGANLETVDELQSVLRKVQQPASRGSIGDAFAGKHVLSEGTNDVKQPTFSKEMIPGLENDKNIRPDRIRPEARRTLDIKTGYEDGGIDPRQLRDVNRLISESRKPGSKVQQWLEKQYGIKGGLVGQDILVMPGIKGDARTVAERTAREVRNLEADTDRPIGVYFMDEAGIVWKVGTRNQVTRIGNRLPD